MISQIKESLKGLESLNIEDRIDAINEIKMELSKYSPMSNHPVDCVTWVKQCDVNANDYNPNSVAPPEMKLLERSILEDGYTMPIVAWKDDDNEIQIVDGFHRHLAGKNNLAIKNSVHNRFPLSIIRPTAEKSERVASTIRHNRARGSHSIDLMVNIVGDLVASGMSDGWIMKHIGMDADELLRLKQISGLASLFKDAEFSTAWDKTT